MLHQSMREINQSNFTFVILCLVCSLNKHVVKVHEGNKQFKCGICNALFGQKRDFNKHVATVNEGKNHSYVKCVMLSLNKRAI